MNCYQKFYTNQIHSSSLLCQLATMWKSQVLCDACIKSGSSSIKAHRVVLLAACPMLQSMENSVVGSHLEVHVASDIKQGSINTFLQYLYEGFMMLTEENCKDVEKIARLLQVDSVIKCCADFYKCLSSKTGNSELSDQYKYTFHDMVEFRHVRSSDLQKTYQDRMMKRGLDPNRPLSPGGKRQRIHQPPSSSKSPATDDAISMSRCYGASAHDSSDNVSRLMLATSEPNILSSSNTVSIAEDRLEMIQTSALDSTGNKQKESTKTSVSVGISSHFHNGKNVQVISIPESSETHSSKHTNQSAVMDGQISPSSSSQNTKSADSHAVFSSSFINQSSIQHTMLSRREDPTNTDKRQSSDSPQTSAAYHFSKRPCCPSTMTTESESQGTTALDSQSSLQQVQGHMFMQPVQGSHGNKDRGRTDSTGKSPPTPNDKDMGMKYGGKTSKNLQQFSSEALDLNIVKTEMEDDEQEGLHLYIDEFDDTGNQQNDMVDDSSGDPPEVAGKNKRTGDAVTCCDQTNAWYLEQIKDPHSAAKLGLIGQDVSDLTAVSLSQALPPIRTSLPTVTDSHAFPYGIDLSISSSSSQNQGTHHVTTTDGKNGSGPHKLVYISNRKPCMWCQIKRVKTKSGWYCYASYRCEKCDVPLCKQGRDCFLEYHKHIGVPQADIVKEESLFPFRDSGKDDSYLISYAASLQNKTF